MKPTAMLYRSLLAIETEEVLRCHPVDGAVLMGGCDKTTPALLLGAISMNLPSIFLPAGPMLTGRWRNKPLGSGTDTAKAFNDWKAGLLPDKDFKEMEEAGARSPGHCMTMGTASSMTAIAEAMGITLSGASSIPAPDSRHRHMAVQTGRRSVEIVLCDLKPKNILSDGSFKNAIITLLALGGSTNAVIHLVAMARRAGISLDLSIFDALSRIVPVLADLKPSGQFLMEDFFEAGGLRGLLSRLVDVLDADAITVSGQTLVKDIASAKVWNNEVIRPREKPVQENGGLVILHGNIAPQGAVLKVSAASKNLLNHSGRAFIFEGWQDFISNIDRSDLDVDENSILILRNCGPRGGPGMPEWGMMQVPKKLLERGVRDILRISDARMSGTHFGTVILHVTPEAAIGGPLSLVETGDIIHLDVEKRILHLDVADDILLNRKKLWVRPVEKYERGWARLYKDHVNQADIGADLDFLEHGRNTPEPEIN